MRLLPALLLLAAMLPAQAAVISARPDKVAVVIYHQGRVDTAQLVQADANVMRRQGLTLVIETRTLDLPAGVSQIQFRGVAATMVPQTAEVTGLPGLSERDFDFNLLSPGALIAKSIGKSVRLIRTDKQSGAVTEQAAVIRSGPDGTMLETSSGVEGLGCSGLPERIVFDSLPDNLLDTPTLSVRAEVPRAGSYVVTLRYIATGLNWSADYVARVNPNGRTLDLSGWITLANFSETGFAAAPVEVVAGRLQTTGQDQPIRAVALFRDDNCWQTDFDWSSRGGAETVEVSASRINLMGFTAPVPAPPPAARAGIAARDLGDYKLYALPEPTSVAARQTKQVQFLDSGRVPFRKVYRISAPAPRGGLSDEMPSAILLQIDNTVRGGLGKPLPAGGVSVMEAQGGQPLLAGQDQIDDTASGLPLEIAAGRSMAVSANSRVMESVTTGRDGRYITRRALEVTMTNRKAVAVALEWRQSMGVGARLVSESRRHGAKSGDLLWRVPLKPGEVAVLRYTLTVPR